MHIIRKSLRNLLFTNRNIQFLFFLVFFHFYHLQVLDKCLPILPQVDRMAMLNANVIDLQWIAERTGGHWISGHVEGSIDVDYILFSMSTYFEFSFFFRL